MTRPLRRVTRHRRHKYRRIFRIPRAIVCDITQRIRFTGFLISIVYIIIWWWNKNHAGGSRSVGGKTKSDALKRIWPGRRRWRWSDGSINLSHLVVVFVFVARSVWRRWETAHFALLFTGSHKITRARTHEKYLHRRRRRFASGYFRFLLCAFFRLAIFFSRPLPVSTISYPFFHTLYIITI